MPKKIKFGEYGSATDLGNKIEWEGGLAPFFVHYAGGNGFEGTPIEAEVKAFYDAYKVLEQRLEELGVRGDE